jgi:tRNA (guanine37-N1)-methyltransferase
MALTIDILTLFPEMFEGPFAASIVARAQQAGLIEIRLRNIRDFAHDRHRTADDTPYGGGAGMVMKVEPLVEAIEATRADGAQRGLAGASRVVYLTPQGQPYDQATARRFSQLGHLILVCGHYEGIDERVRELAVDEEISIGDYVLTGGELPAMVIVDSIVRLLPGAVGNPDSIVRESFGDGVFDYPHYTRPEEYRGLRVPEVLLSGHHAEIERWRRREALRRTLEQRPDLIERAPLTPEDRILLEEIRREEAEKGKS